MGLPLPLRILLPDTPIVPVLVKVTPQPTHRDDVFREHVSVARARLRSAIILSAPGCDAVQTSVGAFCCHRPITKRLAVSRALQHHRQAFSHAVTVFETWNFDDYCSGFLAGVEGQSNDAAASMSRFRQFHKRCGGKATTVIEAHTLIEGLARPRSKTVVIGMLPFLGMMALDGAHRLITDTVGAYGLSPLYDESDMINTDLAVDLCSTLLRGSMIGVAMCHVQNIVTEDEIGSHLPGRKWCKKNRVPQLQFKRIVIDPNKMPCRRRDDAERGGADRAWHLARGHLRTYSKEGGGLFGRGQYGDFWIPEHFRGSQKNGEIAKEYSVGNTETVASGGL